MAKDVCKCPRCGASLSESAEEGDQVQSCPGCGAKVRACHSTDDENDRVGVATLGGKETELIVLVFLVGLAGLLIFVGWILHRSGDTIKRRIAISLTPAEQQAFSRKSTELRRQIQELERKIPELKSENVDLRRQLAAAESTVEQLATQGRTLSMRISQAKVQLQSQGLEPEKIGLFAERK